MLPEITKKYNASCILMHIQGTPKKMQINPQYENVVKGVYEYLSDSIKIAREYKIEQLIIDPGIGFGKTLSDNLSLIRNLSKFKSFGLPIIIGLSNKKFIDNISPTLVNERLEGTIASNTFAILNGANILRVHNVLSNRKAAIITDKLKEFNGNTG
jgi:dihydropteroate synthase